MDEDGNDITLSNIYAESESQEGQNQVDIGDISTDPEDETEDEEGNDYEIEEGDEDTLQVEFKTTYSVTYKNYPVVALYAKDMKTILIWISIL